MDKEEKNDRMIVMSKFLDELNDLIDRYRINSIELLTVFCVKAAHCAMDINFSERDYLMTAKKSFNVVEVERVKEKLIQLTGSSDRIPVRFPEDEFITLGKKRK